MPAFETNHQWGKLARCYAVFSAILLADNYHAAALAVATKALALDQLTASDRAEFLLTTGIARASLLDIAGARATLENGILPEARASGNARTLHRMLFMAAGFEVMHAALARGLDMDLTVGMPRDAANDPAQHLARAYEYVEEARRYDGEVDRNQRAWALDTEAQVIILDRGIDAARGVLDTALAEAGDDFQRAVCKIRATIGIGLRLAGAHEEAVRWLLLARKFAEKQEARALRGISYELSLAYEAMGDHAEALAQLRVFALLQARKAEHSTRWFADDALDQRFGPPPPLDGIKCALLRPLEPGYLKRARAFIESRPGEHVRLAEIAAHCGVTVRTLQNAFRRYRGISAGEAVRNARLERAQRLLRETGLSIAEIAADVGYASPSNFSRDYRRAFGSTPAEARRQLRDRPAAGDDGAQEEFESGVARRGRDTRPYVVA